MIKLLFKYLKKEGLNTTNLPKYFIWEIFTNQEDTGKTKAKLKKILSGSLSM